MFGFLKGKAGRLSAVCDGEVFSVEEVADAAFSQKILGDGFAQIPENGMILSPANGVVCEVAETGHAYCIDTDDGLQLLVHIGIDTVKLGGEGFSPCVKKGSDIRSGEPLARVDFETIKSKGYDCTVITVITDMSAVSSCELVRGKAKSGSAAFVYKLKGGR